MFLIILLVGIIPVVIIELILTNVAQSTVISTRLRNVSAQFSMLTNYLVQDNKLGERPDEEVDLLVEDIAGIFMSRIQVIDQDFNIITDTYQINKGKLCISKYVVDCFRGQSSAIVDEENQCIIMAQPIRDDDGDVVYVIAAFSSITDIYSAMESIQVMGATIIVICLAIVLFLAILLSYTTIKPFKKINEVIARIDKGHLTDEIQMKGSSEIQVISESFNKMLERISQLENSRQLFVSNVSHELKTPMTSMKVLADSLLAQDYVPNEMYKEFMMDLSNEINRENVIITDLLTLVKLDNPDMSMNITQTNINGMVESVLRLVRPLAREKNIELVLESYRPIIAEVDEVKLSMAISNLVENGIKYNKQDGYVHVSLNADRTYFYVKVKDNGKGIPADSLPRIFDRFYRVDKARDRATGGSGLGLSITRSIVLAHNGDIKVYSEEGKGTIFNMQIPLTYVKAQEEET